MSDQVSLSPEQQILNLQTELKETKIQLQKLRAAAWGAADSFRREAEDNLRNCWFVQTPHMFEILWGELEGTPEDLELLRWAGDKEVADLRQENERLRRFVGGVEGALGAFQSISPDTCCDQIARCLSELEDSPAPVAEPIDAEGGA